MKRRLLLVGLLAVACGDDGGSVDDDDSDGSSGTTFGPVTTTTTGMTSATEPTTSTTTGGGDVEAPELLDVRVSIDGGSLIDINNADASRVLPDPVPAEFTIRARDDISEDENLLIEIIDDATGEPLPSEAMFVNGLWRVTATVEAANSYRARATDEAANATDSTYALVAPSLSEAIVGEWDGFLYDAMGITETFTITVSEDGTWSETEQVGGNTRSGTWSVEADQITLVEGDTSAEVTGLYADDDYFVPNPFIANDGQDSNAAGSWSRTWTEQEGSGGNLEDARTIEETLDLSDNGDYTLTRTTTPSGGSAATTIESGTWVIELNGEYFANYGDFLVLTTDDIDGTPQDPTIESWSLHRARAGRLLVAPYVPAE